MKKILITGLNSYIGNSFINWVDQSKGLYEVDTISTKGQLWKEKDFSDYDVVFHVAGIVHVDANSKSEEEKALYYKVNRDLTIEMAAKAKAEGVKQFIFMSSIIVYGECSSINDQKIITKVTKPFPNNYYGDSKLQAELGILPMQASDFHVAIIRAPMIYGKNSKGNYPKLAKFAQKTFIFPNIKNQRSMLHIDNLCQLVRLIIDNEDCGIFHPQNDEYSCTSELVKMIAMAHGKKVFLISILNPIFYLLPLNQIKKIFGSLIYDKEMSKYKSNYIVHSFYETIRLTEQS